MSDKKRKTFTLDPENYNALTDHDNASALVNDLVEEWRRGGDRGTAALRLNLRQKKREREIAKDRFEKLDDDVEELEALLAEFESQQTNDLDRAREALEDTPLEPDNPAIKKWSRDLGIEPTELIRELQ